MTMQPLQAPVPLQVAQFAVTFGTQQVPRHVLLLHRAPDVHRAPGGLMATSH